MEGSFVGGCGVFVLQNSQKLSVDKPVVKHQQDTLFKCQDNKFHRRCHRTVIFIREEKDNKVRIRPNMEGFI